MPNKQQQQQPSDNQPSSPTTQDTPTLQSVENMLKHLKMKRQQQDSATLACNTLSSNCGINSTVNQQSASVVDDNKSHNHRKQPIIGENRLQDEKPTSGHQNQPPPRRVRGRRSSKPQMEKRRRARINQCLDILKSYVLTDSTNLSQLGIDITLLNENKDEESIARTILKSSGLINRHRGRKNPNKLEKADILELTVDYVRRLHEQRARLINDQSSSHTSKPPSSLSSGSSSCGSNYSCQSSPSSATAVVVTSKLSPPLFNSNNNKNQLTQHRMPLTSPLMLNLSAIDRHAHIGLQATPPSPPPSSASSSPQPLLTISSNIPQVQQQQQQQYQCNQQHQHPHQISPPSVFTNNDILDLSNYKPIRVQSQVHHSMSTTSSYIY